TTFSSAFGLRPGLPLVSAGAAFAAGALAATFLSSCSALPFLAGRALAAGLVGLAAGAAVFFAVMQFLAGNEGLHGLWLAEDACVPLATEGRWELERILQ